MDPRAFSSCKALVHVRRGKRLRGNSISKQTDLILLSDERNKFTEEVVVGRQEILPCLYAACGCDDNIYSTNNKCVDCQEVNQWAPYALSRKMLRFSSGKMYGRGRHALILVNSKSLPTSESEEEWQGGEEIQVGTRISLMPLKGMGILDFEVVLVDRVTKEILEPDATHLAENFPSFSQKSKNGNERVDEDCSTLMKTQAATCTPKENKTTPVDDSVESYLVKGEQAESSTSSQLASPRSTSEEFPRGFAKPRASSGETLGDARRTHNVADPLQTHNSSSTSSYCGVPRLDYNLPKDERRQGYDVDSAASINRPPSPFHSFVSCDSKNQDTVNGSLAERDLVAGGPEIQETRKESGHRSVIDPGVNSKSIVRVRDNVSKNQFQDFILFFCPLGQDLPVMRRKMLSKKAVDLGARVVEDFRSATHIIISEHASSLSQVSKRLVVPEDELKAHIDSNKVQCVLPKWVAATTGKRLRVPSTRTELWHGYIMTKKRKREEMHRGEGAALKAHQRYTCNHEVAELFRQLSNLHQSCPLLPVDTWKAYCFRVVAGRIMNLSFEISNNSDTLERLRTVKGIGSSSFEKIKEYLSTGSLSRIREFQTDPQRVAMKNMMDIWGVGRVKASELVHRGYSNIEDVRRGIQTRELFLDRNQLVGVDCYEDVKEEMKRHEVESIGRIVEKQIQQLYPGAEVQIMGSYRRGKAGCGDVDVHITHKSYVKKIPGKALGEVVDALWRSGHIAFHLTFLSGMKTGLNLIEYQESGKSIPRDAWELSKVVSYSTTRNGEKSSSYMGVFHSPTEKGKRRRVDFKIYPYRERIFASLYFTGNGFFNRSMRLWAARKFSYTLNDHGLFVRGTMNRVMEASQESEVFEKLQLVYKDPCKRDCFDAVEPMKGTPTSPGSEMTEAELYNDNRHLWVN